jgi:hypothetical protein
LFYLSKDDRLLAGAALERAYAMHKGLYAEYELNGRKDLQKIVLERYRMLFHEFHGLTTMNKYQEFATWLYGYCPATSQKLFDIYHGLWLIKHKLWNCKTGRIE